VFLARDGALRPAVEWTTTRYIRGEHRAQLTITAAGRYTLSVAAGMQALLFSPQQTVTVPAEVVPGTTHAPVAVPMEVVPGATHAGSSVLRGTALSLATAGRLAWFTIEARDKFGNLQLPSPSPDIAREAPGASPFQARDKFGNMQLPSPSPDVAREAPGASPFQPSPDVAREAPGASPFQVEAIGPGGSVQLARVVEQADGTHAAGLIYTDAAPHLLSVT
ncbi:hypothetical protein T484DRAFT_1767033, partial [Baffinella frigidus]